MNKKCVIVVFLAVMVLCAPYKSALSDDFPYGKDWLSKSIITEGEYVYSVGHSPLSKTEIEAKDAALDAATKGFIRYCKVSVDSFDRSIEIYSIVKGKEFNSTDLSAQNTVRAKAFVSRAVPEEWHIIKADGGITAAVLLKVPKSEYDRISSENNIKISLDVLFYFENDAGRMQVLSDGAVLKSGGGYALYVKPSDTCYIYVYQIDHLGKSFRLFPNAEYKTASNPVSAASDLWAPSTKELFVLDSTTGKEYFYLFASLEPIKEFEGKNSGSLERADIDNIVSLKKMGVAGLKKKRELSRVIPPLAKNIADVLEVKKKLQAEGAFVYETWFWHK